MTLASGDQHHDHDDRNCDKSIDHGAVVKGLDRIRSRKIDENADQRCKRDHPVEHPPLGRIERQADFAIDRFAERVGGGAREHGN